LNSADDATRERETEPRSKHNKKPGKLGRRSGKVEKLKQRHGIEIARVKTQTQNREKRKKEKRREDGKETAKY